MSMNNNNNNNNNPAKNVIGFPTHFVNSNAMAAPVNRHQPHLLSHQQGGHFQLSEPQVQALAQSQYASAQSQSQFQAQAAPTPAKRPNQRPPSRPSSSNAAISGSSPFKTMELTPAARRKKRKLSDLRVPERAVASLLPESALYTQLLEYEARMDAAVSRQKMDIQESFKFSPTFNKTLRIYVFNTFTNQNASDPDSDPPTWSLKIIGRILEDGKDPVVVSGTTTKTSESRGVKFSSFFKKVTVYLDQGLYPGNNVVTWDSVRSPVHHEGFEVKRKGDKEFTAAIRLDMNYSPEKFKLSPALSEALGGIEAESRARVTAALWHYVKSKRLQIPTDPGVFICDPPLRRVFGEDRMRFAMVSQKLSQHLTPPQPIHIEHRIKLSGENPAGTSCYDVLVDVPLQLDNEIFSFLAHIDKNKEIDAFDELISSSIKKIHEHRRRRAFFLGFSQSPAEFINALIASQSKDLKLISGDAGRNSEKERLSDFYEQPWVEDAVIRYLNRKSAGIDAPGSI